MEWRVRNSKYRSLLLQDVSSFSQDRYFLLKYSQRVPETGYPSYASLDHLLISYAQAAVRTLRSTAHSFSTTMAATTDSTTAEFSPSSPPPSSTIANASVFTKNEHDIERATPPEHEPEPEPPLMFTRTFCQRGDPEVKNARKIYLRSFLLGLFLVVLATLAVLSIYWDLCGTFLRIPPKGGLSYVVRPPDIQRKSLII
jgi:hypothetical protein